MQLLARATAAALLAVSFLSGLPAGAQDGEETLTIGPTRVLVVRTTDTLNGERMTPAERVDHVHDVFSKHLGGSFARFTTKKWGDRVHLYLNGDFVLAVTPADARATGYRSAEHLAPVWLKGLETAFRRAHAQHRPAP